MSERLFLRLDGDPSQGPESHAPAGTLRGVPVEASLRPYVSHVLLYRESIAPGREVIERVLPDGAVRLVFNLGDAPSVSTIPGQPVEAIGASTEPALVCLRGRQEGISVALRPGAAAAVLGVPAGELAGTAVALDDLWRGEAALLLEQMAGAPSEKARAAIFQAALQQRLRRRDAAVNEGAMRAARLIAQAGGRRALRDVADAVGVGERRLQQLFHAHVGLTPRAFSRLARMHGCLRLLRLAQRPAWTEIALDAGFYDQSHLVNEFRALCGLTPAEFFRRATSGSSKTDR